MNRDMLLLDDGVLRDALTRHPAEGLAGVVADDIRTRIASVRQRRGHVLAFRTPWSSDLPGVAMDQRRLRTLWVIAVLVATLLAVTLAAVTLIGSRQRTPTPFGTAGNGLIAFAASGEVFVSAGDGSGRRSLPIGHPRLSAPSWSASGTRLAMWSTPVEDGPSDLIVSNADGSDAVVVAEGLMAEEFITPSWAPDGQRLVVGHMEGWRDRIVIADVGTRSITTLGDDALLRFNPSWSPDGQWILFMGVPSKEPWVHRGLYVIRPDGTGERRLEIGDALDLWPAENPAWAPDPRHHRLLYYIQHDRPSGDIEVFDLDLNRILVVSGDADDAFWPTWSPDGTRIAWYVIKAGVMPLSESPNEVRVAPIDEAGAIGTARVLATTKATYCETLVDTRDLGSRWLCSSPMWSPDGRFLYGVTSVKQSMVLIPVDGPPSAQTIDIPGEAFGLPSWQRRAP